MATFQHADELRLAPEEVFGLFVRPAGALDLVPDAGVELLDAPDLLVVGALLTLRTRRYGLTQKHLHRVEVVAPPERLVVVQVRGPLKAYRLEQRLEPAGEGTRLVEAIDFEPPGGVLGQLVTEAGLRREFADLYQRRREAFAQRGWLL